MGCLQIIFLSSCVHVGEFVFLHWKRRIVILSCCLVPTERERERTEENRVSERPFVILLQIADRCGEYLLSWNAVQDKAWPLMRLLHKLRDQNLRPLGNQTWDRSFRRLHDSTPTPPPFPCGQKCLLVKLIYWSIFQVRTPILQHTDVTSGCSSVPGRKLWLKTSVWWKFTVMWPLINLLLHFRAFLLKFRAH